jgi:electron transport complex protein RnfG
MAKLKSTFKNMFLSLFTICFVVAVLLAQVNKITAKPIAEAKAKKLENAIREVVPPFDNNPVAEAYKIPDGAGDSLTVYPAKKGDELVVLPSPVIPIMLSEAPSKSLSDSIRITGL